ITTNGWPRISLIWSSFSLLILILPLARVAGSHPSASILGRARVYTTQFRHCTTRRCGHWKLRSALFFSGIQPWLFSSMNSPVTDRTDYGGNNGDPDENGQSRLPVVELLSFTLKAFRIHPQAQGLQLDFKPCHSDWLVVLLVHRPAFRLHRSM